MKKKSTLTFYNIPKQESLTKDEAIHEAAHAILFVYAGYTVAITPRLCKIAGNCTLLGMLAGAIAGFTADKFISELSDVETLIRTRTDREQFEFLLNKHMPDPAAQYEVRQAALQRSQDLVMRFKSAILKLARLIQQKRGVVSTEKLESIKYVQKIRALGASAQAAKREAIRKAREQQQD